MKLLSSVNGWHQKRLGAWLLQLPIWSARVARTNQVERRTFTSAATLERERDTLRTELSGLRGKLERIVAAADAAYEVASAAVKQKREEAQRQIHHGSVYESSKYHAMNDAYGHASGLLSSIHCTIKL